MEFSYKVSEAEYLRAWKLRRKGAVRSSLVKTVLFWVFILVCLMLLWGIVQRKAQKPDVSEQSATTQQSAVEPVSSGSATLHFFMNIGPFIALGGFWVFYAVKLGPTSLRRLYRKDPAMQGQFTVNITQTSISGQNTSGSSWQAGWNLYDYWREGKDVILLVYHSSAYFVISLAGLSEVQRNELRSILTSVLPKR